LDGLPETPETIGTGVLSRIQILNFGWRLGMEESEAADVFADGDALAKRHGLIHGQAMLRYAYAGTRVVAGLGGQAVALSEEALRLAEDTDDLGLKLGALGVLAYGHWMEGNLREALLNINRAIEEPHADPKVGSEFSRFSPYIFAIFVRATTFREMGRYDETLRDLDRARELAEAHGEMEILGWVHGNYGSLAQAMGDDRGSLEHARKSSEIAEKIGSSQSRISALWDLGTVYMVFGKWNEAQEAFEQGLTLARERQAARSTEAALLSQLAEAYLHLGKEALARKTVEEAAEVVRQRRTRIWASSVHLTRARILLRTEGAKSTAAIEAALASAQAAVEESGAKRWEPFIYEEKAELARLSGDEDTRRRALREAHRLFTEMGATGHAERMISQLT
jgi:tetratricopeptide (TPR) repeat protein